MNSLVKLLNWSDFFREAQEYGKQFIDENRVGEISKLAGDGHIILHRQLGKDIPDWIRNRFNSPIEVLQVFASQPGSIGRVHKDGIARKSALNVPVLNSDQGYTEWFTEQFKEVTISNAYTQIRIADEESTASYRVEVEPEYRIKISTPSILNTDRWHRVNNRENTDFRYMISFRFINNPSFDELCAIIGDGNV